MIKLIQKYLENRQKNREAEHKRRLDESCANNIHTNEIKVEKTTGWFTSDFYAICKNCGNRRFLYHTVSED